MCVRQIKKRIKEGTATRDVDGLVCEDATNVKGEETWHGADRMFTLYVKLKLPVLYCTGYLVQYSNFAL